MTQEVGGEGLLASFGRDLVCVTEQPDIVDEHVDLAPVPDQVIDQTLGISLQ